MAGALVISSAQELNYGGPGGVTPTPIDTSGADLLVVSLGFYGSGTGFSLSDNKSNMWFGLTLQANSSIQCKIYYAKNATVGSGHTFTFDGTAVYPSIGIMAFSGSDTTSPFDQENGAENAGTTSLQTGSVTPSTNAQILVAALGFNTANTISVNSSFTGLIQQNFTGGVEGMAMAYLIQTTAGAVNPTFSWSSSSAAAAAIATFKTAAAGGFSPGWANRSTSGIAGSGVS